MLNIEKSCIFILAFLFIADMDEFGMGGQPHDYVIYSQQGRPSSGSRPPSGSRTRSVTLTGSGVRPSSGSAINTGARQSSVRPLSGVRYSRPASAEGSYTQREVSKQRLFPKHEQYIFLVISDNFCCWIERLICWDINRRCLASRGCIAFLHIAWRLSRFWSEVTQASG